MSLQDFIPTPEESLRQAKFHNAQIAVDMSYRIAEKIAYLPEEKVPNPDWKEGDPKYEKHSYVEAPNDKRVNNLTGVARLLRVQIEQDLNDTLKLLEKPEANNGNANGASPTLSRFN